MRRAGIFCDRREDSGMNRNATLTEGSVGKRLFFMTVPMLMGIFSIMVFNLADTYFVAQLGTEELAAMSFTFPVVMVLAGFALGLGTGAASVVSRAIGRGGRRSVRRFSTDSLTLSLLVVFVFSAAGFFTIGPVFSMLGAEPDLLPLIRQYMSIWYFGMIFLVVPMVGNSVIRATGDTKYPSLIMMTAAGVNIILDPLMIFGLAGFPRLGLAGAALATVVSRALTCAAAILMLHFRERLIDFSPPSPREIIDSWKKIMWVGIPAAATRIMVPVSMGILVRIVSGLGKESIAAFGAGARISSFAMIPIFALSSSLIPVIGQNWGAGLYGRVDRGRLYSSFFSFWWGIVCVGIFLLSAGPIARLFSEDPDVARRIMLYLWIVPLGLGLQGVAVITSSTLNAINKPINSALLVVVRLFVLYVPLTYIGSRLWRLEGLFGGMALANIITGILAVFWVKSVLRRSGVSR